jgi:hypothetical protein
VKTQDILHFVEKAKYLENEELLTIRAMIEEFPFFQIPYVVLAKREHDITPEQNFFLSWAAVHSSNRKRLKTILTGEKSIAKEESSKNEEESSTYEHIINSDINDSPTSKEVIVPRKKLQEEIIETYSKTDLRLNILDPFEKETKQEDLSKPSTVLKMELVSEPYAKLLVKQGKISKAIEIYEKLMVKFPNKNSYFAKLIKDLE